MQSSIRNEFIILAKSKIKAGEGIEFGLYPFFTSSDTKVLSLNTYCYDDEVIILGTGGKPSCNYALGKFSYSTDNYALKSRGNVLNKFLYYFLRKDNLQILHNGFHGAGLKHIGKDYILDIEFPYFDMNKQNAIVSILDNITLSIDICKKELLLLDELIKSRFMRQGVVLCY